MSVVEESHRERDTSYLIGTTPLSSNPQMLPSFAQTPWPLPSVLYPAPQSLQGTALRVSESLVATLAFLNTSF